MNSTSALSVCLCVVGAASSARAGYINHTDLPSGLSSVTLVRDGVTIDATAVPRPFRSKTVNGVTGVGVAGGSVHGEIDNVEMISFAFSEPVVVSMICVTHLFTAGNFGDTPDEVALIDTDAGRFTITASGDYAGAWTGLGDLSNLSVATTAGAGQWMANTDPLTPLGLFGAPITRLTLLSGNPSASAARSDYSFVDLEFSPVPVPSSFPLLAVAGAGVAGRRRRVTYAS